MKVIHYLKSQFEIIKIQIIIFNTQDNCSDSARLVFSQDAKPQSFLRINFPLRLCASARNYFYGLLGFLSYYYVRPIFPGVLGLRMTKT